MARPLPGRVSGWLVGALVISLVGLIGSFVASQYGDGGIPVAVRAGLLVAGGGCLVVFFVQWWRWSGRRRADGTS
jgi:hypothetical protein